LVAVGCIMHAKQDEALVAGIGHSQDLLDDISSKRFIQRGKRFQLNNVILDAVLDVLDKPSKQLCGTSLQL
jgi:hypothetical protein